MVSNRKPRPRRTQSFSKLAGLTTAYDATHARGLKEAYFAGIKEGLARSRTLSITSGSERSYGSRSRGYSTTSMDSDDDVSSYPSNPGSRRTSKRDSGEETLYLSSDQVSEGEDDEPPRKRGNGKLPKISKKKKANQKYAPYGDYEETGRRRKTPQHTRIEDKKPTKFEADRPVRVHKVNHPLPNVQNATKERGMVRIKKLAEPKQSLYMKTFAVEYRWGDQGVLRPVNPAALKCESSPRVVELATAKKDFQSPENAPLPRYVINDIDMPIWEVSENAKKAEASGRVVELAKPKTTTEGFEEHRSNDGMGRSTPIWQVSKAAMSAQERPRTNELAKAKKTHPQHEAERPVVTRVTQSAIKARASARIEQLSRPKSRKDVETRDSQWAVSRNALTASPRKRTTELAQAKQLAVGYQAPLEPDRPVDRSALRTAPTKRIQMLAIPIIRPETSKG